MKKPERHLMPGASMPVLTGSAAKQSIHDLRGKQSAQKFKRDVTRTVGYRYLIYVPEDYAPERPVPLVLFLHGAGERGSHIDLVRKHGPPKLVEQGKSFPFLLVSPQCRPGQWWEPEGLNALVEEIAGTYNADTNRLYVTGLSMGGFGTWSLGIAYPDKFAALVPICGWGDAFSVSRLRKMPVWAFHGARDHVVPLAKGKEMVEALKRAGGSPRFTVYPDAEHDSWSETYDNPELYSWLLQQRKYKR